MLYTCSSAQCFTAALALAALQLVLSYCTSSAAHLLYTCCCLLLYTCLVMYLGTEQNCCIGVGVLKAGTIQFEPELPAAHAGAIKRLGFGLVNKVW